MIAEGGNAFGDIGVITQISGELGLPLRFEDTVHIGVEIILRDRSMVHFSRSVLTQCCLAHRSQDLRSPGAAIAAIKGEDLVPAGRSPTAQRFGGRRPGGQSSYALPDIQPPVCGPEAEVSLICHHVVERMLLERISA
jgi:hypothetical protein